MPHRWVLPTSEPLPLCFGSREARPNALMDPRALELRNRPKHTQATQPAGGRARVSMPSASATKAIPRACQLVQEQQQVTQVAPESVEPPADDGVDPMPSDRSRELIEAPVGGPSNR